MRHRLSRGRGTDRDRFQIASFHAFYKAAALGGLDRLDAFVSAIVKSSDDETDKVLARDPGAIQRWLNFVPPEEETLIERNEEWKSTLE